MSGLFQQEKLKPTLKITNNMQQNIEMLQMSNIELSSLVVQALDRNPFLEEGGLNDESELEISWLMAKNYQSRAGLNNNFLENIISERSLKDHISEQISLEILEHHQKLIAYYLLDSLQSNGYLPFEIDSVAKNLKCSKILVSKVLTKLQSFDPVGVFARNLTECLKLQLEDKGLNSQPMTKLLANLDLLARSQLKRLAKICQVSVQELKRMVAEIQKLNPKPASSFIVEPTLFKIPDVILTFDTDGGFKLALNHYTIPNLQLNQPYCLKVKSSVQFKPGKQFVRQELSSAKDLIKGIERRAKTILKVARAIIEQQIDFFAKGILHLKPLTLNDIAVLTNFNESTISRSTANKYLSAPCGIYELKYFFCSSITNTRAAVGDISSTKVKQLIKQLIINEEPGNVMSDQAISMELQKLSINVSRRTVTKYRTFIGLADKITRKRRAAIRSWPS